MKRKFKELSVPECVKHLASELGTVNELKNAVFDWDECLDVINNNSSRIAILMMNNCLFREANKSVSIRKSLLNDGKIESVIALPSKLMDGTMISTSLVVFSNNNSSVMFVYAAEVYECESRAKNILTQSCISKIVDACSNETSISKKVDVNNIDESRCDIYPTRYVLPKLENGVEFSSLVKKTICGTQLNRSKIEEITSEEPTGYQYINPKYIRTGITEDDLPYLKLDIVTESCLKHRILDGYFIISKVGAINTTVAKISEDRVVIAEGRIYAFELDTDKVNPYYLKVYFDSEQGKKTLSACNCGSAIGNLNLDLLMKIQIPLPSIEEQNKIVERIW